MKKHLIVNMCVREGERTYDIKKVVTVPSEMSQFDIEKKVIFEDYGETEPDDNAYYYYGGEIAIVCDVFTEITKEELEVLNKFL